MTITHRQFRKCHTEGRNTLLFLYNKSNKQTHMNSTAIYTTPVNRIKQRILFDDNLNNVSCLCPTWEDFVIEISEWGIYKLGGVDFDTLTEADIKKLDQFMHNQNGYED